MGNANLIKLKETLAGVLSTVDLKMSREDNLPGSF